MIDPDAIPQFTGDLAQLESDVTGLKSDASAIGTTGANIHSTFQGLAAFYEAPEAEQLFATTKPVADTAKVFESDLEKVAAALSEYASEVRPIAQRLKDLKEQASTFVAGVKDDHDWQYDSSKVDQDNKLRSEVDAAVASFWDAERHCANKIEAVFNGTTFIANDGSNKSTMYGYSAQQLDGASGLPWGDAVEQKHHWYDAWYWGKSFVSGVVIDGVWGTLKGLGGLVGLEGWNTFVNSWKGLGELGIGLASYGFPNFVLMPIGMAIPDSVLPKWVQESRKATREAGKSMLAWDEWGKNPARAAGGVVFNVLTLAAGGEGAGLNAAGDAGKASVAARAIGMAGKVGEVIDPMTYIAKGVGAGLKGVASIPKVATALDALGNLKVKVLDIKGLADINLLRSHGTELPDQSVKLPNGWILDKDNNLHLPDGTVNKPPVEVPAHLREGLHVDVPAPRELVGAHAGGGGHELASSPGGHEPPVAVGRTDHQVENSVGGGHGTSTTPHAPTHTGGDASSAGHQHDGSGTATGHGSHGPVQGDGGLPGQRGHDGAGGTGSHGGDHDTGRQGAGRLTAEERQELVRKQVERANNDPAYFKKYYQVNGHRHLVLTRDADGHELPQLRENPDPNGPKWILATDGPPPIAPRFHSSGYTHGIRLPDSHPKLPELDTSAAARHHAITVDQAHHEPLKQLKEAHQSAVHTGDPQAIDDARHLYDQAKEAHRTPHREMTEASEAHGDRAAEFHAVPEHFPEARRVDDRATGNNRFDQIWERGDGGYIVVEAKGGPHTDLGDRAVGGGVRAMQGTREYFESILHEMRDRGFYNDDEANLERQLRKALKKGDVSYLLVKAKDDGTGQYAGYLMKLFNIY
ncbi:hypothetical protein ACIGXM_28375 [Kitasatospora sp. NPDC052896]|uniref:hypothetical protein n=1 Tax=Kitasatospora sp. NPDC052896 TaxID=3364061 RepID=UPI0037C9940B